MTWECSECGNLVERERRPVRCPECGLAGVLFSPAEVALDDECNGLGGYWFTRGASMSDYVGPPSFTASGA